MTVDADDVLSAAMRAALPVLQQALDKRMDQLYKNVLPKLVQLEDVSAAEEFVKLRPPIRWPLHSSGGASETILLPVIRQLHERRTWSRCSPQQLEQPEAVADDLALRACDAVLEHVLSRATVARARVSWVLVPPTATSLLRPSDSTKCVTLLGPDSLSRSLAADSVAQVVLRPCESLTWAGASVTGTGAPVGRLFAGPFDAVLHTALRPTLSWDRTRNGNARITVTERSCLIVKKRGAILEIV